MIDHFLLIFDPNPLLARQRLGHQGFHVQRGLRRPHVLQIGAGAGMAGERTLAIPHRR